MAESELHMCIMCRSRRIQRKLVSLPVPDKKGRVTVEAEVCEKCGETYLDIPAMRELEGPRAKRSLRRRTG